MSFGLAGWVGDVCVRLGMLSGDFDLKLKQRGGGGIYPVHRDGCLLLHNWSQGCLTWQGLFSRPRLRAAAPTNNFANGIHGGGLVGHALTLRRAQRGRGSRSAPCGPAPT